MIFLVSTRTKTGKPRAIPITGRQRAVLGMRTQDADGQAFDLDAYVFGNEVGEQIKSIKTAWKATCKPARITGLHFHDLRRASTYNMS